MFKPLVGIWASVCIVGSANSAIVAEYDATADGGGQIPLPSSPWNEVVYSGGAGTSVTTDTNGDGVDYMEIEDTGSGARHYVHELDASDFTDPNGWTVTGVAQIPYSSNTASGVMLSIRDGSDRWTMHFVQDQNDEGQGIWADGGTNLIMTDVLSDFRTYQIVYDPTADNGNGAATFYVDGQPFATIDRAQADDNTQQRLIFGTANSGASSESRWSYVSFETGQNVVPEPATFGLMALGGLMMRRRRR